MALDEMEKYVQARIGGNAPAQTTGAWAVAKFEHDSSRPVDGYAAPQLHTHAVIFNVTETAEGKHALVAAAGTLQDAAVRDGGLPLGAGGAVATAWATRVERGAHGQPEIKGYTREYLEASSPRRQQIEEQLREQGRAGRWSGADRRAPDARCEAAALASKRSGRSIKSSPQSMEISRSV